MSAMDDDMEPGEQPASHDHEPGLQAPGSEADPTAASASASAVAVAAAATAASASARPHPAPLAAPTLYAFLLNTPLNSILAGFLATRDLFFLQFLNRNCFTLLNSNAALLQQYYTTARLDSFIPFLVDDSFISSFLTPSYLSLPDGSTAVRNTYSMHIRHLRLNFCTRISNRALQSVALHIGPRLLSINIEGGGRSRINEAGMHTLFGSCTSLTSVNLNGFYQLNMVDTIASLMRHCAHSLTDLSLNGCAQLNETAIVQLTQAKLQSLYLNCCNVTDASLSQLACAFNVHLRVLHIGYCGAVTDRGLAALVNHCRAIQDLNLYGCTGLSRHAPAFLRLLPQLSQVDVSRIHALDDGSIAEWVLPTAQLHQQQQLLLHMAAQAPAGIAAGPSADINPNLPQIFAAQQLQQSQHPHLSPAPAALLRSVSLDSCSRVSSLGLKVLLEHCPSLTHLNAFGVQNLSRLGLESLLRIAVATRSPLRRLEVGGCAALNPREVEALRREFAHISF